jgi:glucans biosynthesis protein C
MAVLRYYAPVLEGGAMSEMDREASHSHEERLHALDLLRAAAMFLGIVLHAAVSFIVTPFPWLVHDARRSYVFDVLLAAIHGFRMQVFFFLAGFFAHLLWQRLGARGFLIQRGRRIGLPLLLGMIIIVPITLGLWLWADARSGAHSARRSIDALTPLAVPSFHLWFLEVLLLLYAAVAVIAWIGKQADGASLLTRFDRAFDWLIRQRLKPFLFLPPTILCLWGGPFFGEVDQMGMRLLPSVRAVAYFGLFFSVGWWMHRRAQLLETLRLWNTSYFVIALIAFLVLGACHQMQIAPANAAYFRVKLLALTAAGLYAWCMTFAVTGVFLRFANGYHPWKRYLADASYWCYLAHLPLVGFLQIFVAASPLNPWLKFAFILVVNIVLLLPSYHWCVRYTWLGSLLNGPRTKSLGALAAQPAARM